MFPPFYSYQLNSQEVQILFLLMLNNTIIVSSISLFQ